jgi:hypothetical protein
MFKYLCTGETLVDVIHLFNRIEYAFLLGSDVGGFNRKEGAIA